MYSGQSVSQGLKAPPTTLSRSTSNGMLMDYSEKAQQQDMMDVDCSRTNNNNVSIPTGLMRYRSAPSSFFASLVDEPDDYLPRVTSPEPENVIARYFSADSSALTSDSACRVIQPNVSQRSTQEKQQPGEPNALPRMNNARIKRGATGNEDLGKHHHLPSILENGSDAVSHNNFCNSQMMYQAQDPRSGMENAYRMNPVCCNPHNSSGGSLNNMSPPATKSTLIRHSSSPAGLLSRLIVDGQGVFENGYPVGTMKNMGNLASEKGSCSDMVSPSRLKSQMSFSRQSSSPGGLLSQLSEMGMPEVVDKLNMPMVGSSAESLGGSSSDDGSFGNGNGQRYVSSFPVGSWEDATMVSENFAGMQNGAAFTARKCLRELNGKMVPGLNLTEPQKGEPASHVPSVLNHQFSLPKTASEIAMEKLLQDSVPCKIRAKRGCATHPRSIAERVRRTRISERMRKLQELVPNMDKQTNTADMLDEAVDYIKFLQRQVQELSENRCKCNGSCKRSSESIPKAEQT